jgi:aerobic carbon-monoxide dehydrogenase small subunit
MSQPANIAANQEIRLNVNGQPRALRVYPMTRLLDVLRTDLGLTGAKEGCGEGECGSCSILMDGELVNSCLIPVAQADGATVVTIEGLTLDDKLHALQESFLNCNGAQCGICTPGMILASVYLLARHSRPTMEQIREGLSGNLCRCTGYTQIFEAVRRAVERVKAP